MSLTNLGQVLGQFLLQSTSQKLSTLSGIWAFFTNSFWLASFLALLIVLNVSYLTGVLAWFFKITKAVSFKFIEVFCKDLFLTLYFSLFSSMTPCISAFFHQLLSMLIIWLFVPPPPQSVLQWRPHKELWFNESTGVSTSVFF